MFQLNRTPITNKNAPLHTVLYKRTTVLTRILIRMWTHSLRTFSVILVTDKREEKKYTSSKITALPIVRVSIALLAELYSLFVFFFCYFGLRLFYSPSMLTKYRLTTRVDYGQRSNTFDLKKKTRSEIAGKSYDRSE